MGLISNTYFIRQSSQFLFYLKSDWIEFYLKRKFDVFLWNYRGYGYSTGSPSPRAICSDIEQIVDYLTTCLGYTSIAIHGQSIGGMFAIHGAEYFKACQFLLADRTFASFANLAYFAYNNNFLHWIINIFPSWNLNLCSKFINSRSYKVIANDSRDTIIPWQSSLLQGVMDQLIFQHRAALTSSISFKQKKKLSEVFIKQCRVIRALCCSALHRSNIIDHYIFTEICSFDELNQLLVALQRLVGVIVQMSSVKREKRKKIKHQRAYSSEMPELYQHQQAPKTTTQESNSLDSSFAHGYRESSSTFRDIELTEDAFKTLNTRENDLQEIISEEQKQKVLMYEPNEAAAPEIYMSEEDISCESFMNLILEVYGILDLVDSCGLLLTEIVLNYKAHHLEILKGLEFYGSYLPIKVNYKNNITLSMNQKISLVLFAFYSICLQNKVKDFLSKLDKVIRHQIKSIATDAHLKVLKDLNTIYQVFYKINDKLQSHFDERNGSTDVNNNQAENINNLNDSITNNDQPIINTKEVVHNKLLNLSNAHLNTLQTSPQQVVKMKRKYSENQLLQYCGNYIPLSCGHNGPFNNKEVKLLDFHLKRAGLILETEIE